MPRNIQKAIEHLEKQEFSVFNNYVESKKIFKKKIDGRIPVTFHKHFNIDGEFIKNMMISIGFMIKDEWYQPGRFYYPYHLIVGEKK
jgi:hypothetical protein